MYIVTCHMVSGANIHSEPHIVFRSATYDRALEVAEEEAESEAAKDREAGIKSIVVAEGGMRTVTRAYTTSVYLVSVF